MAWSLGGMYLLLLESAFALGFVWTFHWKPEFAQTSGFWIFAILTAIVLLVALGFETLGFFGTARKELPRWWHSFLRVIAYLGVAAWPLWKIWPFALAAWIGWDANP
ncbi:MAG: hypothetical protein RL318_2813 [Fibrobacterota bacterium]|jgi:hypothetical protein